MTKIELQCKSSTLDEGADICCPHHSTQHGRKIMSPAALSNGYGSLRHTPCIQVALASHIVRPQQVAYMANPNSLSVRRTPPIPPVQTCAQWRDGCSFSTKYSGLIRLTVCERRMSRMLHVASHACHHDTLTREPGSRKQEAGERGEPISQRKTAGRLSRNCCALRPRHAIATLK